MSRIQKSIAKWVGALALLFCSFSYSNAQTDTNNILGNNWSGADNSYTGTGAGFSGGHVPGYNSTNNTIYFGYTQSTVAQTIAINNALQGTGIQVGGVKYGFSYLNEGDFSGTLSTIVNVTNNAGALLYSYSNTHGATNNWTSFNQVRTFTNVYDIATLGNVSMNITGKDSRFWAGYYGPQVRDPYLQLTYSVDPCVTNPQSSPTCPGFKTYYTLGDDSYAHVPLPFGFPFYGRTFTNSWMHSNGVVSFLDPLSPIQGSDYNPGAWAYCCGGPDLSQNTIGYGSQFNYVIAPFWTDLYPSQTSEFYTTQNSNYIRYHWKDIADISNGSNLNTFSLELRPTGYIGVNYTSINSQQPVTIGTIGDLRLGEKTHQFFGIPGTTANNWSLNYTQATDCSNPLNNTLCPGYAEAYLAQQCSVNPLYNPSCPGYAQAYFTQQCSLNSLYNVNCPGYAAAYLAYQCSINPLYSTTCDGYEQAYFNQQCSLDGLYSKQCPNYADAYALKMALEKTTPTNTTTTLPEINSSGETKVALVSDPLVNEVVTTTATSASPAQAATATVPLVQPPQQTQTVTTAVAVQEQKKDDKKDDTTTSSSSSSSSNTTASDSSSSSSKDQPKTARQELQERRQAAARAKAVEDGKNLAENVGKAADMEQQKAVQNVVVQAMSFVPGFDAYSKVTLTDKPFYKPEQIYKGQVNVDNKVLSRRMFGPTDQLHNEMVESQYQR